MKLNCNLHWLFRYWLLYCAFPLLSNAQTNPTILLSKNTISSVLQDQLIKSLRSVNAPPIKDFIYYAPSYCLENDSTISFSQIVCKENVDFNKIDVLGSCGDINTLKLSLLALNQNAFIIISGKVFVNQEEIKTVLNTGLGSTDELNKVALDISTNKVINQISLKDLAVMYDQAKLENIKTTPKFTSNGLIIGQLAAELSKIPKPDLDTIILELQSTGITSIGTFLPLDFINKQFDNLVIPYNDGKGSDIELQQCKFTDNTSTLTFHTILSGKTIRNRPIHNQYLITAEFNPKDLSLISLKSKLSSGTDNQEAGLVRSIVNLFENELRGKKLFKLPNEKYYKIKSDHGEQKINIQTYYGRFINGVFAFVNSLNIQQ